MIDFVIERDIARSPADVFAYAVDATKLAQDDVLNRLPEALTR